VRVKRERVQGEGKVGEGSRRGLKVRVKWIHSLDPLSLLQGFIL
jgi:hypothetical protein